MKFDPNGIKVLITLAAVCEYVSDDNIISVETRTQLAHSAEQRHSAERFSLS
jgi:hypothetical protein